MQGVQSSTSLHLCSYFFSSSPFLDLFRINQVWLESLVEINQDVIQISVKYQIMCRVLSRQDGKFHGKF